MFGWCINCTVDSQVRGLNIAFYLLHEERYYTRIISQLFLQIKPIMTFSILNQYFKGPLFYRTSHQYFIYFIYFNNLSFITEPDEPAAQLSSRNQNKEEKVPRTYITWEWRFTFSSLLSMSAKSWAQSQELTISSAPAVTLSPWDGRLVERGLFCSP